MSVLELILFHQSSQITNAHKPNTNLKHTLVSLALTVAHKRGDCSDSIIVLEQTSRKGLCARSVRRRRPRSVYTYYKNNIYL